MEMCIETAIKIINRTINAIKQINSSTARVVMRLMCLR